MESSILKQIARFLQEQKKQRRWLAVFLCMALIVGFGTVTALKMRGQAMTHKEKVVVCPLEVHQHTEECWDENKENLICGYADYVVHVHNDDCYDWNGNLTCKLPEIEKHEHTDECYTEEKTLVCGQEESAGHQHGAECYTREQGGLICQVPEHIHTAACYDETGAVICGMEEHTHTDDCYEWNDVLTCQIAEGEGGHTHTDACYEVKNVLTCGKLELHTHTDECYEKINEDEELSETNRRLVCTIPVLEEHIHTEDAGCFETVIVNAEGEVVEEETTEAANEEEVFTTDLDEEETAESEEADANTDETDADSEEEQTEDAENAEYEIVKTYDGDGYKITASYNKDADIPEEAELIAEQITVDSDEEHYTEREAQYRKSAGTDDAVMKALFKIGFYIDGEEVEPKTPVNLTIQLLDEKGLPEGAPITVVHFAEKGTEVLDGSEAESGSTSFDMNSFSEVGIGYRRADAEEASVNVSNSYEYESAAFHFTFHIEGKAKILEETADEADEGNVDVLFPVGGNGGSQDTSESEEIEDSSDEATEGEDVIEEEETTEGEGTTEEEEATEGEGTTEEEEATEENGTTDVPETSGDDRFELRIKHLEKGSKEYQAAVNNAALTNRGSELLYVQAMSYSMYYEGNELDLSDCDVAVDVQAVETLSKQIEVSVPTAVSYLRETGNVSEDTAPKEEDQYQTEVALDVVSVSNASTVNKLENTVLRAEKTNDTMTFEAPQVFAARALTTPNPNFKVQYYANLEKVAYDDPSFKKTTSGTYTNELPVINTAGGKLPTNGSGEYGSPNDNSIRTLYVNTKTGKLETKPELTKVYEERPFEYLKAPTINYMNALIENPNYELKEVWVLKAGKSDDSIEKDDWNIYTYDEHLHFTNRELSEGVEEGETYVLIPDGAVIRFVYNTTSKDKDFEAAFYDYDIGDGYIYKTRKDAQEGSNKQNTSNQGTGTWYMKTNQQGINSADNYTGSGTKFAFGNANTGSGLQSEVWNGNLLNKLNAYRNGYPSVAGSYQGCTFGLVTGLNAEGEIQYAPGVIAPNLFNDGKAAGKTAYDEKQYSLKFDRVGDTHTLIAVNGTSTNELDSFNNPRPSNTTTHYHIWTNNFWPMDSAPSYGTDGHDMKFSDDPSTTGNRYNFAGQAGKSGGAANGRFPLSDDGTNHNSYFGMHYKVEFDLAADYVGPLEYYFFGDDDMWVFLSDSDGINSQLVCDIGGVHRSVGEYINLWDYINKDGKKIHRHTDECYGNGADKEPTCGYVDTKKFTLDFFYTERGESGSTCWMQFTLPSVTSLTPETTDEDYGHLEVRKDVKVELDGKEYAPEELFEKGQDQLTFFEDKEFTFEIKLQGPNGTNLKDDYAYVKYNENGEIVAGNEGDDSGGGILPWETIANGETFTLKDGEYVKIRYLPEGTTYTITEIKSGEKGNVEIEGVKYHGTVVTATDTVDSNELKVSGTIPKNDTKEAAYVNKYTVYELPETGGPGPIVYTIAGVLVILFGAGFMYRKKVRERRV